MFVNAKMYKSFKNNFNQHVIKQTILKCIVKPSVSNVVSPVLNPDSRNPYPPPPSKKKKPFNREDRAGGEFRWLSYPCQFCSYLNAIIKLLYPYFNEDCKNWPVKKARNAQRSIAMWDAAKKSIVDRWEDIGISEFRRKKLREKASRFANYSKGSQ